MDTRGGIPLIERIARCQGIGDPSDILGPDALAQAARLVMSAIGRDIDPKVLTTVATLHWIRYCVLQPEVGGADLDACTTLFGPVALMTPEAVPPPVLEWQAANTDVHVLPLGEVGSYYATVIAHRAMATRHPELVDLGVEACRAACQVTEGDDLARHRFNLQSLLSVRHMRSGATADLDEAVAVARAALTPSGHPLATGAALSLGEALYIRFTALGRDADLDEAAKHLRLAKTLPPDDGDRLRCLLVLSSVLGARCGRGATNAEVEEYVAVARDIVATCAEDDPDYRVALLMLGDALRIRFIRGGETADVADIDESVGCASAVLAAAGKSGEIDVTALLKLMASLTVRIAHAHAHGSPDERDLAWVTKLSAIADAAVTGDHQHRDEVDALLATVRRVVRDDHEAVERATRAALADVPAESAGKLFSLGDALLRRYDETGDTAVLPEVTDLLRRAEASADDRRLLVGIRLTLAKASRERFRHSGEDGDLDAAVDANREAVRTVIPDQNMRARQMWQHANLLLQRFMRTRQFADLEERIEMLRAILPLVSDDLARADCLCGLASASTDRFRFTGDRTDLDRAVDAADRAAGLLPTGHPGLPRVRMTGVLARQRRFNVAGDPNDITEAVRLARSAVDGMPADDPHRPAALLALAVALGSAARDMWDAAGLTEAIETCRAVMALDDAPHMHAVLTLSEILVARHELTGATEDLAEAATALRSTLSTATLTSAERGALVNALALVLHQQFQHLGASAHLDESIEDTVREAEHIRSELPAGDITLALAAKTAALRAGLYELRGNLTELDRAVAVLRSAMVDARAEHPALSECRLTLGDVLTLRFQHTTETADVEKAIAVLREGLAEAVSPQASAEFLVQLGLTLLVHAEWSSVSEAHDEAIDLLRKARHDFPVASPRHPTVHLHLGQALLQRYEHTGDLTALTEAIDAARTGIRTASPDHMHHAELLTLLGTLLTQLFERTEDVPTLDEAVEVHRRAVATTTAGNGALAVALSELASSLRTRYYHHIDPNDLDETIAVARRATELPGLTPFERASAAAAMADALLARGQHTGDLDDITAAVDLSRDAVAGLPAGHSLIPVRLMALAAALRLRFGRTGAIADLHEAIDLMGAAVNNHGDGAWRSVALTDLGDLLCFRARLLGSSADLDAAVDAGRAAVATASGTFVVNCLRNLAAALHFRFAERQDPADLDAAIHAAGEAVERCPERHPQRGWALSTLAELLYSRDYVRPGTDDLDRAIDLQREALACTTVAREAASHRLFLAFMLCRRYDRRGRDGDATEAAALARQVVETIPADDLRHAATLFYLGEVLNMRHQRHGAARDLDEALMAYSTAARSQSTEPMVRARAAEDWARLAARQADWPSAVEGFSTVVALLPQLAWHGVERGDRERRLGIWEGLASAGAAAALAAGDPDRAVELLEQGRSVLWSQVLQTRDDMSMLRERDPALHDRLRALSEEMATASTLDRPTGTGLVLPTGSSATDAWRDQRDRIQVADEWDRLLAQARTLPGLEHLLRVPPLAALRDDLPDGPVVLINVHDMRCDALIVRRDRPVEHVPLPGLSSGEAAERTVGYLRALRVLEQPPSRDDLNRASAKQTLHVTLEWLWDVVAEPVLGHLEPADGGRLWWCPTGPLTLLPLHAAGYHDPADTPAGRTVLDRAVSSYTPTLRALARARKAEVPSAVEHRLLMVGMPETPPTPGMPAPSRLPGVHAEAAFFERALPRAHTQRIGDVATHATVTADLRTHTYAHFACHGEQNLHNPSTGALHLWDKPLTVLDVAKLDLEHAELAYLSACHTAVGGTTLPDEAIHLAAALQLAGYRHVIATLWTVSDQTAVEVATSVYSALLNGFGLDLSDTAHILHRTVRALRDAAPRDPTRWAPFIHSGP